MADRRIEYVPLATIQAAPRNPKRHAVAAIRASVDRFGLGELPLVDERTGRLVAGHGRLDDIAERLQAGQSPPDGVRVDEGSGDWLVPIIKGWASRSDAEAEAYLVASNKLTTKGGWDDAALAEILGELEAADLLELTGFTGDELAALLASPEDSEAASVAGASEAAPSDPPADPVTKPGDVWQLGPHWIACGDCRDFGTVSTLLDGVRVNVAFTSPPYASQRKYDESSGFRPIPPEKYTEWFTDVQANVRAVLADDGSWFVNIKEHCEDGQRHLYVKDLTVAHVRRWGWRFVDELAWVHNGLPGTWDNRHKNQFEPVFHFSAGRRIKFAPLANGVQSKDAFSYSGALAPASTGNPISWSGSDVEHQSALALPGNVIQVGKSHEAISHQAMFPVALPAWFIRAYSDPGDAVFDPFMGSGSTLIAAHNEGRVAYGCEISPAYADVICARFQRSTGIKPVLAATGELHDFGTEE